MQNLEAEEEGNEAVTAQKTAPRRKRLKRARTGTSSNSTGGFQGAMEGATRPATTAASSVAAVFLGTVPGRREEGRGPGRGGKVRLLGSSSDEIGRGAGERTGRDRVLIYVPLYARFLRTNGDVHYVDL